MNNLIDSKSILAKLMATENITIEQKKVQTASFDLNSRVLTVPVLNNNIDADTYDLFMGHEVGHALYTDFNEWKTATVNGENMSVINVIEDFRIEKMIKYKYPGLKSAFYRAYNGLFSKNFFKTEGKDLNKYNFIDRINLHTKIGVGLNIIFNENEQVLLKKVESVQTFQDVVDVQREIVEYMKEEMEKNQPSDEDFDDFDDEQEEQEMMQSFPSEQKSEKEEEGEDKGKSSDGSENHETSNSEDDQDESSDVGDDEEGDDEEGDDEEGEIRSLTDEAFKQNEYKLFDESSFENLYLNIPESIDLDNIIIDYVTLYKQYEKFFNYDIDNGIGIDTEGYMQIRANLNKSVSYLVKEFELRKNASQMKKSSVSKTGDLNMQKIFSYQFNEDIFKKMTITDQGKSHGLVLFLDWSGSMKDHLTNTVKQLFSLVMFCKKVNIPFEVYAFCDRYNDMFRNELTSKQVPKPNDIEINKGFNLMNILSSRMNALDFKKAASILTWVSKNAFSYKQPWQLGGTPLSFTIMSAMEIIPAFQKKNNLQVVNTIFLTDGEDTYTLPYYYGHDMDKKQLSYHYYENNSNSCWNNYSRVRNRNVIFRDSKSRHEFKVSHNLPIEKQYTNGLIGLLKHRTKTNVIGFYILNNKTFNTYVYANLYENKEESMKYFKKNKHLVVTNEGFDEYYLLKSDKTDKDEEVFEVTGKTSKSIANAFIKFNTNKLINKVVLNRFIGLIA